MKYLRWILEKYVKWNTFLYPFLLLRINFLWNTNLSESTGRSAQVTVHWQTSDINVLTSPCVGVVRRSDLTFSFTLDPFLHMFLLRIHVLSICDPYYRFCSSVTHSFSSCPYMTHMWSLFIHTSLLFNFFVSMGPILNVFSISDPYVFVTMWHYLKLIFDYFCLWLCD